MEPQTWYKIKKVIPVAIYNELVELYYKIRHLLYLGSSVKCPCCQKEHRKFCSSSGYESCPRCGAGARHRNLCYFLENEKSIFNQGSLRILQFAPEVGVLMFLSKITRCEYITADLNSPRAKYQIDMTQIPYRDNFFDIIISSHVLEHIPNDMAAMSELYRVLKPNGYSIHQVPIDYNRATTFEDSSINTNELRTKYYGHLKWTPSQGQFSPKLRCASFCRLTE